MLSPVLSLERANRSNLEHKIWWLSYTELQVNTKSQVDNNLTVIENELEGLFKVTVT